MENERLTAKLRDPLKNMLKNEGKPSPSIQRHQDFHFEPTNPNPRERERERFLKQLNTYLLIASGIGACLLGLGIYWLVKRRAKKWFV